MKESTMPCCCKRLHSTPEDDLTRARRALSHAEEAAAKSEVEEADQYRRIAETHLRAYELATRS